MQELDNNMDELLRKAAERYGLKDGASHWDAIDAQLPKLTIIPLAAPEKNRSKRRILFFLFLIPLLACGGFVAMQLWGNQQKPKSQNQQIRMHQSVSAGQPEIDSKYAAPPLTEKPAETFNPANNSTHFGVTVPRPAPATYSNDIVFGSLRRNHNMPEVIMADTADADDQQQGQVFYSGPMPPVAIMPVIAKELLPVMQPEVMTGNLQEIRNHSLQNEVEQPGRSITNSVSGNTRGLYVCIVGGPSLQEVKSQGMKKAGFDFGIITGYRFSKKISIESGILFAKKYYHSNGKYFNPAKTNTPMPANMKVLSLESSNAVFELPVALKYNLINRNKTAVFAKAGMSSFLLTRETNNYRAVINGTEQNTISTYTTNHRYLVAAINFSAGCERKIGNVYSLRIEPYVALPMKGTGVGSMPLMSTGLHIGITRPFR